jgi:hypothetical protein
MSRLLVLSLPVCGMAAHRDQSVAVQWLAASLGDKKEEVAHTYFQMLIGLGRTQEGVHYLGERATRLLDLSSAPTVTYARALDQLHRSHDARKTLHSALEQRPEDGDLSGGCIYPRPRGWSPSDKAAGKFDTPQIPGKLTPPTSFMYGRQDQIGDHGRWQASRKQTGYQGLFETSPLGTDG